MKPRDRDGASEIESEVASRNASASDQTQKLRIFDYESQAGLHEHPSSHYSCNRFERIDRSRRD